VRNFRTFLLCLLVVSGASVVTGCATTGRGSTSAFQTSPTDMTGIVKIQPPPTANMNGVEKTGYYLGWFSLEALYAWAGFNPTISP
jgi:hypothetical protein